MTATEPACDIAGMGNRTGLWLTRSEREDEQVFEANNALPLFWLAAFREGDLEPWAAMARASVEWDPPIRDGEGDPPTVPPLELRVSWTAARSNLAEALRRAPERVPDLAPRLRLFIEALEGEAARFGAEGLILDAAEWVNFYSQEIDAAGVLGSMLRVWHGEGAARPPPLYFVHEADGIASDPVLRRAQVGWPFVPLAALPVPPKPPSRPGEWLWTAGIVGVVVGAYAVTGSVAIAALAFVVLVGLFLWAVFRV